MTFVYWDKTGKPISNNQKEQERLDKNTEIIISILEREYGYKNAKENYIQIINELAKGDFGKYLEFRDKVRTEAHNFDKSV